jgi:hypothetical protein
VLFWFLTAVSIKTTVFLDVAPCTLVEVCRVSGVRTASIFRPITAPMMQVANTSETSVNIYQTARCNIAEDSRLIRLSLFVIVITAAIDGLQNSEVDRSSNKLGKWHSVEYTIIHSSVRMVLSDLLLCSPAQESFYTLTWKPQSLFRTAAGVRNGDLLVLFMSTNTVTRTVSRWQSASGGSKCLAAEGPVILQASAWARSCSCIIMARADGTDGLVSSATASNSSCRSLWTDRRYRCININIEKVRSDHVSPRILHDTCH